jgi:Reverse transcriptase (RNA-dependent DNA polymerase)
MDVKSAYLNMELCEEIFMKAPPGFNIPKGMVLQPVKAVYGTKQGDRVWYEEIRDTLTTMGYQCTDTDHAVFIQHKENGDPPSLITLYVDDITMAAKCPESIQCDKEALKAHYQMSDLCEIMWILGMHVTHNRQAGWIALSQEKYVEDMLLHFGKPDACPINTPSLTNERLTNHKSLKVEVKLYQHTIGSLMYPMLGTHLDLGFMVASLGQHTATLGEEHQCALNWAFWYLHGTSNWKLVFHQGVPNGLELHGYADADWASDTSD